MSDGYALLDILFFAVVAVFIAARLRSVLGRRTGHERPRPPRIQPQPAPATGEASDKVVPLPDRRRGEDRHAQGGDHHGDHQYRY